MFVSLEGLDGVGKSTQARLLAERLRAAGHEVVECREPGGTPLGEHVRALVLDHGDWDVSPRAEALLFAASRAQLVADVIAPALRSRRLGDLRPLHRLVRGLPGRRPRARPRRRARGQPVRHRRAAAGPHDRSRHDTARDRRRPTASRASRTAFRAAVSDAFAAIAAAEPARVVAIDADADVATVAERVWAALGA